MESNWRFNVALIGMSKSDMRLYASFVGETQIGVADMGAAQTGVYQIVLLVSPMGLPWTWFNIPVPAEHPHFPYGNDVEPD